MEDPLRFLPLEICIEIFSYLSGEDLFSARQVNQLWRNIANSEYLWKALCERKKISYFIPQRYCGPLDDFCDSARKYLVYQKTLKYNWISGKSHVLYELSGPTTESLTFWERKFVKTYNNGHVLDIFEVKEHCSVHRLQRIDTRFKVDGCDHVMINEYWLTVSRVNTQLLYKLEPNTNEYKLKWILILEMMQGMTKYLYVDEHTSLDVIDAFIHKYQAITGEVRCHCTIDEYVWIYSHPNNLVIKLCDITKRAVVIQKIPSNTEEFGYDKKEVAAFTSASKIGLFNKDGSLKFLYPDNCKESEKTSLCLEESVELKTIKMNHSTVAFGRKMSGIEVVLVDRLTYKVVLIDDCNLLALELHPSEPLVFIMSDKGYDPCGVVKCHSTVTGQEVWLAKITFLPTYVRLKVINERYLLQTSLQSVRKDSIYDCNTGKLLSILERTHMPVFISDVFTVYKFIGRTITVAVKCYL